ncbi:hypothetical protein HDF25_003037 [Pedobacter cryoconitis]|uniref:Uncharacterized protein n=1 Tax=Pedobacter cryoconitis TaxID=188932 RepID=A0A7X0J4B8_9SPHI|nr:hypothetical protein [Pedobacter cryoconitis]
MNVPITSIEATTTVNRKLNDLLSIQYKFKLKIYKSCAYKIICRAISILKWSRVFRRANVKALILNPNLKIIKNNSK